MVILNRKTVLLYLLLSSGSVFGESLDTIIEHSDCTYQDIRYVIEKGDNLTSIASRYYKHKNLQKSISALIDYNKIADRNLIYAGQFILIPYNSKLSLKLIFKREFKCSRDTFKVDILHTAERSVPVPSVGIIKRNIKKNYGTSPSVKSSRIFSGPSHYPPHKFAAYGLVAFRTDYSSYEKSRFKIFCEAYASTIIHSEQMDNIKKNEQMVTVWPVRYDDLADDLNESYTKKRKEEYMEKDVCKSATRYYNLNESLNAIRQAEYTGLQFDSRGPFLIAWSPAKDKGIKDTLVLVADLSDVNTFREAQYVFWQWSKDIESNPNLWTRRRGFDEYTLKIIIRRWADNFGPKIWSVLEDVL